MFNERSISRMAIRRAAVAGVLLPAALAAQSSGYVYTVASGEACFPSPTCILQIYDSWTASPYPVWMLITHNFNPGGGSGLHYPSTPFYDPQYLDAFFPYLAGDYELEDGHAFNLLTIVGPGTACPFVHTATAANSDFNFTRLDHASLNGAPGARLLVTPIRQDSRIHENVGVWYDSASQRWNIFFQNSAATMEVGTKFVVLPDTCSVGLTFRPVHVATAGNTSGPRTVLDDPAINGRPSAVLYVTQVWDENTQVYNDRAAAVDYDLATQRWRIFNDGGDAMPLGARFFWATATLVHRCDFELGASYVGFDRWVGVTP